MASQVFQHAAITDAAIDVVWRAMDVPETWASVPGVDRVIDAVVAPTGELSRFSFETMVAGKRFLGWASPAGREQERMIAWDITTTEIKGRVTVGLSPDSAGTRVYVKLDVSGVGVLGTTFFPVITGAIGDGFIHTVNKFVAGLGQAGSAASG